MNTRNLSWTRHLMDTEGGHHCTMADCLPIGRGAPVKYIMGPSMRMASGARGGRGGCPYGLWGALWGSRWRRGGAPGSGGLLWLLIDCRRKP